MNVKRRTIDRMLVLLLKHIPKDHHDWEEVSNMPNKVMDEIMEESPVREHDGNCNCIKVHSDNYPFLSACGERHKAIADGELCRGCGRPLKLKNVA